MFQCHSPKSSYPLPLPQSPKDCSIHLCLFCCLAYRVIVTIFLNSILCNHIQWHITLIQLSWCLTGKESSCPAGDGVSILGLGRSPGGGSGNPFQYSCLENPMDRGAWEGQSPWVCKELDMTEHTQTHKGKRYWKLCKRIIMI